jgi:cytochrome o ubiquinol oxidase subunit III
MTHPDTPHEHYPDTHHDTYSKTIFGFWLYLLTDFMLFAALFATYGVLSKSTFGGPSASELFDLPFALVQTLLLLTSGLTSGLATACAHRKNKRWTVIFFSITCFLGIAFLWMETTQFSWLIQEGSSWKTSAFLSAFFTLVATHGIHMVFAILWVPVLLSQLWRDDLTSVSLRRLVCLKMLWQFLNIIWVLIFTVVYMMGRI